MVATMNDADPLGPIRARFPLGARVRPGFQPTGEYVVVGHAPGKYGEDGKVVLRPVNGPDRDLTLDAGALWRIDGAGEES